MDECSSLPEFQETVERCSTLSAVGDPPTDVVAARTKPPMAKIPTSATAGWPICKLPTMLLKPVRA